MSDETDSPWLFHINGNAIYHVGDPDFRDYIKKVRYVDLACVRVCVCACAVVRVRVRVRG